MKKTILWLVIITFILAACGGNPAGTQTLPASGTLPGPVVDVTHAPDSRAAADAFLAAWQAEDYAGMYAMLTQVGRDAISQEVFTARYSDAAVNLTLVSLDYEITSALTNPTNAQVAYRVVYHTNLLADLSREIVMNLVLENGAWKVQWDDGLILPELSGGNSLALEINTPKRANIYDRNEKALVADMNAYAIGIVPANIGDGQEGSLLTELANLTNLRPEAIKALYDSQRSATWYIPVGEAPATAVEERYNILSGLGGLFLNPFTSRYFFDQGIAPHVTGYVQPIPVELLAEYQRLGYSGSEKVGMAGLEKWGEQYLAGTRGGSLYVVDPQGNPISRLAQNDARPSQAIYTTLDGDFQFQVQRAIAGFKGAIVVLERDTGRVLAMASSPTYDPNLFEPTNQNSNYQLTELLTSNDRPLVNRAAQGGYPLGSVFKIITMAAALESGLYTPEVVYDCTLEFTDLAGQVFYDWRYERGLGPAGPLTLSQGLMRSCNTWFYHLGLDLYRQNLPTAVSDMARGFGLGSATGIGQIAEDVGNIPDPANEGDAVQMGIGQGAILVTPLQVADFIAAIGNGGTLYRPQVVEKIVPPDGIPIYSFTPEVRGTLPISTETLTAIQDAMLSVVEDRNGTAHRPLLGLPITVYGKTGTAQNPFGKAHAWFAGYTDEGRTDLPDIAVVVIAENSGEGSEIAAPIFRRVIEIYYNGRPLTMYPWETSFYVTQTPTLEFTYTFTPLPPEPTGTATPVETATPIQ